MSFNGDFMLLHVATAFNVDSQRQIILWFMFIHPMMGILIIHENSYSVYQWVDDHPPILLYIPSFDHDTYRNGLIGRTSPGYHGYIIWM